jgi:hypothetical protein
VTNPAAWVIFRRRRTPPRCPLSSAGSTGRRNTGVKSLCWGFKLQGLAWSFVELTSHFVQIGLRVHRQVGALWKVLSQQAIGVLVRPALPRALRITKIDVDFGRQRKATMIRKFLSPIPGQGLIQLLWQLLRLPDERGDYRPGGRRDGQDQPGDPVRPRRHLNSIEWMAPAWADGSGTEVSWSQNATRQLAIGRLVDYRQTLDKKRAPRLRSHCSYNGLAGTRRGWDGSGP